MHLGRNHVWSDFGLANGNSRSAQSTSARTAAAVVVVVVVVVPRSLALCLRAETIIHRRPVLTLAVVFRAQSADEQLRQEVTSYSESLQMLSKAVSRYHTSGTAIETLSKEEVGKDMLVPLTESLYVPGKIARTDKVLLDVGTGYFIDHDSEKGVDYCKLKVNFIKENMDKLMSLVQTKRKQLLLVQDFLRARVQEQADAQAGK